jgi:glyoxalase family protein
MQPLAGLHHVSALSADIVASHEFHTGVLGLRPVVRTVNQDEPTMYHLFFGDGAGSPGSDLTVFDMPEAARERRGNNSIVLTTFRVSGVESLEYWSARLREAGVPHGGVRERDGRSVVDFEDAAGTVLSLVDDGGAGVAYPWSGSTVPAEYQVRGLGYTAVMVPVLEPTRRFLEGALGLRESRVYAPAEAPHTRTHVYVMGDGGVHAEVHVQVRPDEARARYGAGGVHHVALRVREDGAIGDWSAKLAAAGYANSGVVDRHYFRSVYVREPNGVLFELATDGPGFDVDGPLDGERLALPPFLEPRRSELERVLKPLPPVRS